MLQQAFISRVLSACACAALATLSARAEEPYPALPPATHASPGIVSVMNSFFAAKSGKDLAATMGHFAGPDVIYIDAILGSRYSSHDNLQAMFGRYMPRWPEAAKSYPTRVIGDENSAIVFFTDTPEMFGNEIRIMAAVTLDDGKVVRWVDYWDGRHFGREATLKFRRPAAEFTTTYDDGVGSEAASPALKAVLSRLSDALATGDVPAATALFGPDAVFEDMTLRMQILGPIAIGKYLDRSLASVPYGSGSKMVHVVGSEQGGGYEWEANDSAVRRGITAVELDAQGRITRLTALWDGTAKSDDAMDALIHAVIER